MKIDASTISGVYRLMPADPISRIRKIERIEAKVSIAAQPTDGSIKRPRYMEARILKSGVVSYYWKAPYWSKVAGCNIPAEPLGQDYALAVTRCGLLNKQWDRWRELRRALKLIRTRAERRFGRASDFKLPNNTSWLNCPPGTTLLIRPQRRFGARTAGWPAAETTVRMS